MSSQTFKSQIPNDMFFNFLDVICNETDKYYIYNNESYKRGIMGNDITNFLEKCRPFYHLSKRIYLDKKLTYNSLTTVIRQICKYNKITFASQIKYDKSDYTISYYIYKK
jgi:hypothetical protein